MEAGGPLPAHPRHGSLWARWRLAWFDWRNSLLADPVFRRRSAAAWPTRWIARRRAAHVFDIVAGFVYSQVLLAIVRLGLPQLLAKGPLTVQAIAAHGRLTLPATERLLAAGAALQLLEPCEGLWGLGVLGAPLVDNPGLLAMVEHHSALYADLSDPLALLRGEAGRGSLGACWPYATRDDASVLPTAAVEGYSRLMAASQPLVAGEILAAYAFHRHRHLLDVGGGDGSFLSRVHSQCPALSLTLFDLPAVAALARQRLGASAQIAGGSFRDDALPVGADVVTLVRVLHDHDDEVAQALLRKVALALPPGGTLVVAEPLAGTPGAEAMGDAYFGMYLLAMGSGRPRTLEVLRSMLAAAGFTQVREHPTTQPMLVRVVSALRPLV